MSNAWLATGAAVARRPTLWPATARQVRRLAPRRWWARPPFLPLPDRAWMRFRLETQYGDPSHRPVPADVVTWLEWSRANAGRPGRPRHERPGNAGHPRTPHH